MEAASNNRLDFVIALMNHPGIDVNAQDHNNRTALHWAVGRGHPAILAQLLRDDRIDCSLKNMYNYTPLKVAIDYEHDECVKLLREHGAPED